MYKQWNIHFHHPKGQNKTFPFSKISVKRGTIEKRYLACFRICAYRGYSASGSSSQVMLNVENFHDSWKMLQVSRHSFLNMYTYSNVLFVRHNCYILICQTKDLTRFTSATPRKCSIKRAWLAPHGFCTKFLAANKMMRFFSARFNDLRSHTLPTSEFVCIQQTCGMVHYTQVWPLT